MANVNKVILIGRLGRDPERRAAGNTQVCNFSIATEEKWKDKNGEQQKKTEWHNIVAWGRQAELCDEYLKKGQQVYIEGKLQTRKWEDKDGKERYTTETVVQNVQFLEFEEKGGGRDQDRDRGDRGRNDRDDNRRDRGGRGETRGSDREDRNDRSDRGSSDRGGAKSTKQDDYDDDIPF